MMTATATQPTLTRDLQAEQAVEPEPEQPTPWELLRSPLPPEALSPLSNSVGYGTGMTAIDKAFIYDRLNKSGLDWGIPPKEVHYEDMPRDQERKDKEGKKYTVSGYESTCTLTLRIDGKDFPGVGGDWNLGWGDARKGAFTDAFGRAAMLAGIGLEVWLDQMTDEQKAHLAKAPRRDEGHAKGGFDSKAATLRARAAVASMDREWSTCSVHGDTVVAGMSKDGKVRLSCPEKAADGSYCATVWWENKIPPVVVAAIKNVQVTPEPAPEEIPW